jgi:hypothetical protein
VVATAPATIGTAGEVARVPVRITGADLDVDETHCFLLCRGAGTITLTLPTSNPANAGHVLVIKNLDVGTVVVNPQVITGDLLDGSPYLRMKKGKIVTIVADGAGGWHTVARTG